MDSTRFEALGLVEKITPQKNQIFSQLARARRDLLTSDANLTIDEEWAYTIAYHAMLRAGRALLLAHGYRTRGKDQHKTTVTHKLPFPHFNRLFTAKRVVSEFTEVRVEGEGRADARL